MPYGGWYYQTIHPLEVAARKRLASWRSMIGADIILFSEQGFGARVILVAVWGLVEAPPPPPTFV